MQEEVYSCGGKWTLYGDTTMVEIIFLISEEDTIKT
jgi:hypothetical protein